MRPGSFFRTCLRCNGTSKQISCDASCVDQPSKEQQEFAKRIMKSEAEAEKTDMTSN